jgi:hypothetical protein
VFFLSSNSEAFSNFQVTAVRFPFKFIRINPFAAEATKVTLQNVQLLVIVETLWPLFKTLILLVREDCAFYKSSLNQTESDLRDKQEAIVHCIGAG